MSEPTPSLNIDDDVENVTIIKGGDSQVANSNKQHSNAAYPAQTDAPGSAFRTFSVAQRQQLRQTLNALPLSLFDDLVHNLAVPTGIIPGVDISQKDRCRALLSWSKSIEGIGLARVEELLIPMIAEQLKSAQTYLYFVVIKGENINDKTIPKLQPMIQLLRQITGDDSIGVTFVEEGSIKIVLSGSAAGLKKLQALYDSGELESLDIPSVETVQPVDNHTAGDRKSRLVQVLKLRGNLLRLEQLITSELTFTRARLRALARASANEPDRANDERSRAIARASASASAIASARTLARAQVSARAIARALERNRASVRELTIANARALARELTIALALASAHASILTRVRVIARAIDRTSASVLIRANDLASAIDRDLDYDLAIPRDLDLTNADLRGANLSDINLVNVNLTKADLTGANVQGTLFGNNQGVSGSMKRDLQKRGAIF